MFNSVQTRCFSGGDFVLFKRIILQHIGLNNYNNIEIKITRAIKQDWALTRLIDYLTTPAQATKKDKIGRKDKLETKRIK